MFYVRERYTRNVSFSKSCPRLLRRMSTVITRPSIDINRPLTKLT
jgi:hypothetical protein